MVKDPFRKWDRVDTFCTLLVDLGIYPCLTYQTGFELKRNTTKGT